MTIDVAVVGPGASFKETVDRLVERGVSGLPVIDVDGDLVGMVTEADLISKEAFGEKARPIEVVLSFLNGERRWTGKAAGLTAGEVMTTGVATISPDEDVRAAARRMLQYGVKRLPVVDDGRLVGIVSRHDLLVLFHRADADIAADLEARLASPLYAPDAHQVTATVADGVVTLTGTVYFELERPAVVGLASHVPGVVAVVDQITWEQPGPR